MNILKLKSGIILAKTVLFFSVALFLFFIFFSSVGVDATIAPAPCSGNICTGNIVVGGQNVQYHYTQHIRADGTLKIKLNGGVYNTGTLISYTVHGLPSFNSTGEYANPHNGAVVLPDQNINPAKTAFERYDADGCASCIVDQVLMMNYSGLADGAHTFNLTIFQNGDSGTLSGLVFYVDAGAPSGFSESDTWFAVSGMDTPCADGIDNDLNYDSDCADSTCAGSIGRVADSAMCEATETTCWDDFDNDADGLVDCLDSNCDGLVGRQFDGALCMYIDEYGAVGCGDGFDNDGDGLTDCDDYLETVSGQSCWKKTAGCPATEIDCNDGLDNDRDSDYDSAWDNNPWTGVDCADYDCAGNSACPISEHLNVDGDIIDLQCFDGVDNDLDGLSDCADPDCIGMDNGAGMMCYESEFSLVNRYQYCANNFDDDGDGPMDCNDADCFQQFGNCGPCPSREDLTYSSCANSRDDDLDSTIDCADLNCTGQLGELVNSAKCATQENTIALCSDKFDNDNDGLSDCADPNCAGLAGCEPAGEVSCGDRRDNDGDGYIDCVDSNCWGVGSCAPKNWVTAMCQVVPRLGPYTAFTTVMPTVTAAATEATHVNSTDTIRLIGAGTYSSIMIVIGDNTDDANVYPYAHSTCQLTGTGSANMAFTQVEGRVVSIFNKAGTVLNGFDLTFTCPTTATPESWRTFPISISVLKSPGNLQETGDRSFSYILYEDTPPIVVGLEPEGEGPINTVTMSYGDTRRIRVLPQDPGVGIYTSGICSCTAEIDGIAYTTPDGDCITESVQFWDDEVISVRALAEDGVNNIGAYNAPTLINFNVGPSLDMALDVWPDDMPPGGVPSPFFRNDQMELSLFSQFITASSDDFISSPACDVFIRTSTGAIVNGPMGPTMSFVGVPAGNIIRCSGTITLPTMADGEYFLTIRVTDSDGDSIESNRKVLYMCNRKPLPGEAENVCSYADFDRDGSAEGLYSNLYASDFKACDNCVNLYNPSQNDSNANGVGDMCEPTSVYGRCQWDREILCLYDSNDAIYCPAGNPDPMCCPFEPLTVDIADYPEAFIPLTDHQKCEAPWGLCLFGFDYCFDDAECGFCADGITGCREDNDCTLAGVAGPCGGGDGLCADGATSCRRNADCEGAGTVGPCLGANICDNLTFPWLETVYGNVFSGYKMYAPAPPPQNKFNASFCITAKGSIINFASESCGIEVNPDTQLERPKPANAYSSILGKIDLAGLKSGKYGQVVKVASTNLDSALSTYIPLDGKVILIDDGGTAEVNNHSFLNAVGSNKGNGTILIIGGDLVIKGNLKYNETGISKLTQLASVGWMVIPASDGSKGNVYIDGGVQEVVGAFYIAGEEGLDTVAPPLEVSEAPLTIYGLAIARKFYLERTLRNPDVGSERFIYDGRAVANPPPGFADISKSLPIISDTP